MIDIIYPLKDNLTIKIHAHVLVYKAILNLTSLLQALHHMCAPTNQSKK